MKRYAPLVGKVSWGHDPEAAIQTYVRFSCRCIAFHWLTVFVDEKFCEIPLYKTEKKKQLQPFSNLSFARCR